jgi:hypothetical protein
LGSVKIDTLLKVADLVLLMNHLNHRRVEELSLDFDWLGDDPTVTLTNLFVALADMPKLSSLMLDFSCTQSSAIGNAFRQLSPLRALRHVRVRNFMFDYENAPFFDFLSTCTALESLVIEVTKYTHKNRDHFTSHLVKVIDNFARHTKLTLNLGKRFEFDQELLLDCLSRPNITVRYRNTGFRFAESISHEVEEADKTLQIALVEHFQSPRTRWVVIMHEDGLTIDRLVCDTM